MSDCLSVSHFAETTFAQSPTRQEHHSLSDNFGEEEEEEEEAVYKHCLLIKG